MPLSVHDAGLIVFLRLPEKGKVKTRLAATLGDAAALIIYEKLVSITLENVRQSGFPVFLFYHGGFPLESLRDPAFSYHMQSEGDLGQKMSAALSLVIKHHGKAIIIGSDCPDLNAEIMNEAITILEKNDVVLGPAHDGGYYLFGCKKVYPFLFSNISWSTPDVFTQTMEVINKNKLTFGLLPKLHDIDTEDDWNYFSGN